MGFLKKLFGKKGKLPPVDPAEDPNMIQVFDEYGRPMYIHRNDWRDNVLMGNLENAKSKPDELYTIIIQSINDGFHKEVIDAAEHLHRTDPIPERGAVTLGIVYMQNGRLGDAEKVLSGYNKKHGEDGVVLTNLAKVYAEKGDEELSVKTLWHALELDPNQDNGVEWYTAIYREKDGKEGGIEALRRIAALPESWRPQLWLAREELDNKNLDSALKLYEESFSKVEKPIPYDMLMQIGGDLGMNRFLEQIVEVVEPHYDYQVHGLEVGNNLIKAHVDLGNPDQARALVNQLFSLKRPDWKEQLNFWEQEIAQVKLNGAPPQETPQNVGMIALDAPIWTKDKSIFAELMPEKDESAPMISFMGSMVIYPEKGNHPGQQLADEPGRLSRATPLILSQHFFLTTNAKAHAMIPWLDEKGFAVLGVPYANHDLAEIAAKNQDVPDYMGGIVLDITKEQWQMTLRLISVENKKLIEELTVSIEPDNPGPAIYNLMDQLHKTVCSKTKIDKQTAPRWYQFPKDYYASDYLLRIEQQLAVATEAMDSLKGGGLSGEREIIDGSLRLALELPENAFVRMLFANIVRQMKKIEPEIIPEFKEKIQSLQKQHPLSSKPGELVKQMINKVLE